MRNRMHNAGVRRTERVDLQVRGVPKLLRDQVRRRAKSKGMSMSRYVIDVLNDDIGRPATVNEWLAEVLSAPPTPGDFSAAGVVREMRDALEEDIRD